MKKLRDKSGVSIVYAMLVMLFVTFICTTMYTNVTASLKTVRTRNIRTQLNVYRDTMTQTIDSEMADTESELYAYITENSGYTGTLSQGEKVFTQSGVSTDNGILGCEMTIHSECDALKESEGDYSDRVVYITLNFTVNDGNAKGEKTIKLAYDFYPGYEYYPETETEENTDNSGNNSQSGNKNNKDDRNIFEKIIDWIFGRGDKGNDTTQPSPSPSPTPDESKKIVVKGVWKGRVIG